MKRFVGLMCLTVLTLNSCNIEYKNNLEDEEDRIEAYLNSLDENDPQFELTSEGVYIGKYNDKPGYKIQEGDSLYFNYIASVLKSSVFDTNIEEVALSSNIFSDNSVYQPKAIRFPEQEFIEGLNYALSYMTYGDQNYAIIPFRMAYGDKSVGIVESFSTLLYYFEIVSHFNANILEELSEIQEYINSEWSNVDPLIRGFYSKTSSEGVGDFIAENDTVYLTYGIKNFAGNLIDTTSSIGNVKIVANFEGSNVMEGMVYALYHCKNKAEKEFILPSYMVTEVLPDYSKGAYEPFVLTIKIDSIKYFTNEKNK